MKEELLYSIEEIQEVPQHNRLVLYTGIPGVGKDFLLGKFQETDPAFAQNCKVFSFGELLFQRMQAIQAGQCADRDAMRDVLTQEQIAEQVDLTADDIIAGQPGIVNTHVIYRQQQSFVVNPNVFRKLNPQALVFVHADPEDIQHWRSGAARQRDVCTIEELEFFQNLALDVAKRIGEHLHIPVYVLENNEENFAANMQLLHQVTGQLSQ